MDDGFQLTVTVTAEEWARLNMRVRYLEAAVVQAYRNERQLREWFAVSDLLSMELPGLASTRQGILRRAQSERWLARTVEGRGGERYEFHFSALPRRAFAELVRRIVAPPEDQAKRPPARRQQRALPSNAAPPWVLPLMRLLRSNADLDVDAALKGLSGTLPAGAPMPSREEIAGVIQRLGRQ